MIREHALSPATALRALSDVEGSEAEDRVEGHPLCAQTVLYIGHTEDVPVRVDRHNDGRGCIFTIGRRPVRLVYAEQLASRETAATRERQLSFS
jgi:hypothetical protein